MLREAALGYVGGDRGGVGRGLELLAFLAHQALLVAVDVDDVLAYLHV